MLAPPETFAVTLLIEKMLLLNCDVRAGCFPNTCVIAVVRDRSGRMLSAGTALASLPWQRVCRRCSQRTVLVDLPLSSFAGSSDTCYSRGSHRPSLTRTGKAIYGRIICHFFQLKNCVIGKRYTSSPYTRRLLREERHR